MSTIHPQSIDASVHRLCVLAINAAENEDRGFYATRGLMPQDVRDLTAVVDELHRLHAIAWSQRKTIDRLKRKIENRK